MVAVLGAARSNDAGPSAMTVAGDDKVGPPHSSSPGERVRGGALQSSVSGRPRPEPITSISRLTSDLVRHRSAWRPPIALLTSRVDDAIAVASVMSGRGNASDASVQAIRLFMQAQGGKAIEAAGRCTSVPSVTAVGQPAASSALAFAVIGAHSAGRARLGALCALRSRSVDSFLKMLAPDARAAYIMLDPAGSGSGGICRDQYSYDCRGCHALPAITDFGDGVLGAGVHGATSWLRDRLIGTAQDGSDERAKRDESCRRVAE